jgi:hypothetical protein
VRFEASDFLTLAPPALARELAPQLLARLAPGDRGRGQPNTSAMDRRAPSAQLRSLST